MEQTNAETQTNTEPDGAPRLAGGRGLSSYCPVTSLQAEVERFFKTNTFTPMEVTNFYVQARCALTYIDELETALQELIDRHTSTMGPADSAHQLLRRR